MIKVQVRPAFVTWFFTAVVLGLLPWLINLVVQWLSQNATYVAIFRVQDLMYFAITLNATCLLDLVAKRSPVWSMHIVWFVPSMLLVILAALLLGIVSYFGSNPPTPGLFAAFQDRLIKLSLILCTFTLLWTLSMQLWATSAAHDNQTSQRRDS
jgi:hypothetical protein